jgi:hypothetical protein
VKVRVARERERIIWRTKSTVKEMGGNDEDKYKNIHTINGRLAFDLKNAVFWDVTSCGCCKKRRFGGTQCLHHQINKNR